MMSSTDDFKWKPTRKGQCLLCNHGMLGGGVLNDNGLCQSCAWKRDCDEKEETKLEQLKKRMEEVVRQAEGIFKRDNGLSLDVLSEMRLAQEVQEIMGWKEGEKK